MRTVIVVFLIATADVRAPAGDGRRPTAAHREKTPSYYHGWSPDGRTLAFCANRGGNFDLYAIGTEGGEERHYTPAAVGICDGYRNVNSWAPDSKRFAFVSYRLLP